MLPHYLTTFKVEENMYQLFNLGLLIGTKLGFIWWCLLFIGVILVVAIKRVRLTLVQMARQLLIWLESVTKRQLFFIRFASGNQGLPVQLEIFEQNLTPRIRSFLSQLRDLSKIHR